MNNKTKEFMDNFKLGVIGSWGKVEWRDDVYPQMGDNLYAGVDLENFAELLRDDERTACADKLLKLHDENERLRESLDKANGEALHFKSEWYLRGDKIERLTEHLWRDGGWVYVGKYHQNCRVCGRIVSEPIKRSRHEHRSNETSVKGL